ncbi:hypothetical protein IAR55_000001 [Kwoniella newhampshirensis]|uniref:FAD dependent oxidoreductase domain-containing protein n=1 Tax=Kwoniella newhampshirensis TaxID=1651941 RepID=A0AAW0Z5I0_9TREE
MPSYPHDLPPCPPPTESYLPSFWLSEPSHLENERSTAALPDTSDIVIVGSGITGSLLAYQLLQGDPGLKITMLEAREVCSGATARNGGQCKTDPYIVYRAHKALYGPELANELIKFETSHLDRFAALLAKDPIECSFHVTTAFDVCMNAAMAEKAKASYDARKTDWPEDMKKYRELDDSEELERLSGVKGGLWGCMYRVGSIWPYKLATGLLKRCFEIATDRAKGGWFNLQTRTPASTITYSADIGKWTIETSRGNIVAPRVVVATNGYTSHLIPDMSNKVVPIRGTASSLHVPKAQAAGTPSNKIFRPLFTSYALKFGSGMGDYMISRQEGGKEVVLGGAKQGYIKDPKNWYGKVDDSEYLPGAVDYFTEYMPKHFVNWPDPTSNIDKVWTGILGYSSDLLPYVGQHPSQPPGLYVIAGFHGHGMSRIFGSTTALAALMLETASLTASPELQTNILLSAGLPKPYVFTKKRMESKENIILESMGHTSQPKQADPEEPLVDKIGEGMTKIVVAS